MKTLAILFMLASLPAVAQTLKEEVMRANPSLSQCAQIAEIKAHCAADQSQPRAICGRMVEFERQCALAGKHEMLR
jgi:hypothetical protein